MRLSWCAWAHACMCFACAYALCFLVLSLSRCQHVELWQRFKHCSMSGPCTHDMQWHDSLIIIQHEAKSARATSIAFTYVQCSHNGTPKPLDSIAHFTVVGFTTLHGLPDHAQDHSCVFLLFGSGGIIGLIRQMGATTRFPETSGCDQHCRRRDGTQASRRKLPQLTCLRSKAWHGSQQSLTWKSLSRWIGSSHVETISFRSNPLV